MAGRNSCLVAAPALLTDGTVDGGDGSWRVRGCTDSNTEVSGAGTDMHGGAIGEVSGVRAGDIDRVSWTWTVRRQTTPSPGGVADKGTKGKRARTVPLIEEVRDLVEARLERAGRDRNARLFVGPRGGRITTAVLQDATRWDEVVTALGFEHLRRHDLRHTGLTWMADAGVPVHVLRKIAGHSSLTTTQRYLHRDALSIAAAGAALTAHLSSRTRLPQLRSAPRKGRRCLMTQRLAGSARSTRASRGRHAFHDSCTGMRSLT